MRSPGGWVSASVTVCCENNKLLANATEMTEYSKHKMNHPECYCWHSRAEEKSLRYTCSTRTDTRNVVEHKNKFTYFSFQLRVHKTTALNIYSNIKLIQKRGNMDGQDGGGDGMLSWWRSGRRWMTMAVTVTATFLVEFQKHPPPTFDNVCCHE